MSLDAVYCWKQVTGPPRFHVPRSYTRAWILEGVGHWSLTTMPCPHLCLTVYVNTIPGKILIGSALGHLPTAWSVTGPGWEVSCSASSGHPGVQGTVITEALWNGECARAQGCWEIKSMCVGYCDLQYLYVPCPQFPHLLNAENAHLIRLCVDWMIETFSKFLPKMIAVNFNIYFIYCASLTLKCSWGICSLFCIWITPHLIFLTIYILKWEWEVKGGHVTD